MSKPISFTYMSPSGEIQTRYLHECMHCRKEYMSTNERGNSGWCSHRCQTLAMADAYKIPEAKNNED